MCPGLGSLGQTLTPGSVFRQAAHSPGCLSRHKGLAACEGRRAISSGFMHVRMPAYSSGPKFASIRECCAIWESSSTAASGTGTSVCWSVRDNLWKKCWGWSHFSIFNVCKESSTGRSCSFNGGHVFLVFFNTRKITSFLIFLEDFLNDERIIMKVFFDFK